jgi:hypothetical protein
VAVVVNELGSFFQAQGLGSLNDGRGGLFDGQGGVRAAHIGLPPTRVQADYRDPLAFELEGHGAGNMLRAALETP